MTPTKDLRFRRRPIAVDDFATDRRSGRIPTTRLLREADELVTAHGLPAGEPVFLHGDVWPGNIIWAGDKDAVLIDWKTAGVGGPASTWASSASRSPSSSVQKPLTLSSTGGNGRPGRRRNMSPIGTRLPRSTLPPRLTMGTRPAGGRRWWMARQRPTVVTRF